MYLHCYLPLVYKRAMTDMTLQDEIDKWIDPEENLPAELMLDEHHPMNDAYQKNIREVEQKVFAVGRLMKPKFRECARLQRANMPTKDIAKRLDVTTRSVYKWMARPDVIRYSTLLDYLAAAREGPSIEHRKGVLWRVALDNEEKRPNITVQAIQEMNKMAGVYNQDGGNHNNVVNIQINGELLPKGNLDRLPETFESTYTDES
jgi:hypothetical protein